MNYMLGSVNLRDFFEGLSSNIVESREEKSELKIIVIEICAR